jgi:hypothetical protein
MSTAFFATPGILAPLQGLFRWLTAGISSANCEAPSVALPSQPWRQRADSIKNIANYSIRTWENSINEGSKTALRPLRGPSARWAMRASQAKPPSTLPTPSNGSRISRVSSGFPTSAPSPNACKASHASKAHFASTPQISHMSPPSHLSAGLPTLPALPVLRITRVLEAGQAPSSVGRMVISGRMADVCAELDRLVAREAALH